MAKAKDKKGIRASWIVVEDFRQEMRDCFTSSAALYIALQTNTRTGSKIENGQAVIKDVVKAAIQRMLKHLEGIHAGTVQIDSHHHESDVRQAIEKYVAIEGGPVHWSKLAKNTIAE